MLYQLAHLVGCRLVGKEEGLGSIADAYLDRADWVVRYFLLEAEGSGSRLVPVGLIGTLDVEKRTLSSALSAAAVKRSPPVEPSEPITRKKERELDSHFQIPDYWKGRGMWGGAMYPTDMIHGKKKAGAEREADAGSQGERRAAEARDQGESAQLLKYTELRGLRVRARDGAAGVVEDFVCDGDTWQLAYAVLHLRASNKKVLLSFRWKGRPDLENSLIDVFLTKDVIEASPEFDPTEPLTPAFIARLNDYYERTTGTHRARDLSDVL